MLLGHKSKVAATCAVVALVVAACGADDSQHSVETPVETDAGADVQVAALTLSYLLPETGVLEFLGPPIISAVQMAIQEINDAGGVLGMPVELLTGDETDNADRATQEVTRLLDAGVHGIIGAASDAMTRAVIDQITSASVTQCSPSNTGIYLTTYPDGGYYFRTAPSLALQAPALAELVANAGYTTAAVAARADEYGTPFLAQTVKSLEARNVTVVSQIAYEPEAVTFDSVVDAMVASGADAHIIISFIEGALIVQGLRDAGVAPTSLFGTDGIAGEAFSDNFTSADVLEGMRFTAPSFAVPVAFEERLLAFNPDLADFTLAPNAYDCVNLMALAASVAGTTDTAAIREHMIAVTTGDNACATYRECIAFVNAGETIAYQSATGVALNMIAVRQGGGDPSRAFSETYVWQNGAFVSTGRVVGDLAG
jgi:branched-chain amino acid transport system substrate-binding protein